MFNEREKQNFNDAIHDCDKTIISLEEELKESITTKKSINTFLNFHINDLKQQLEQITGERDHYKKVLKRGKL